MKTDHPIYLFLSAGPEAFRVLTGGHELAGPYRFSSLTLKGVERRLDGLFEPEGHAGPVSVVVFQGQRADKAWYNFAAWPPGRLGGAAHRCRLDLVTRRLAGRDFRCPEPGGADRRRAQLSR